MFSNNSTFSGDGDALLAEHYDALRKLGRPVTLVVYPGEGHEISSGSLAEQHVLKALEFFRSTQTSVLQSMSDGSRVGPP